MIVLLSLHKLCTGESISGTLIICTKHYLICTVLMRWLYACVGSLPVPTPSPSPLLQEYTVEFTVQTTTLHEVVHNITKKI